jgi:uncharacterized membrane protein YidH (DUF202 family)
MNKVLHRTSNYFDSLFHAVNTRTIELLLLRLAVFSFVIHLSTIYLANHFAFFQHFQHSYLKAIYTPFSFILFYEVFLLIIIIPNSISEFIGKQFEVITLITLRSFFHDIADFDLHHSISLQNPAFLSLLYDLVASLTMLAFTILYYKIYQTNSKTDRSNELSQFINIKKTVSLCMIVVLLLLSVTSFSSWLLEMIRAVQTNQNYPNPNTVFYEDFFSIMIFVDVLLLIVSFTYHASFFIIFRNASFIITTILLRMSLTIEKPMNYFVIIVGFLFSIISFFLYRFRQITHPSNH